MKMTHLTAKDEAKNGNFDKAWEIAKRDEGLLDSVTKEQWVSWIKTVIKNG